MRSVCGNALYLLATKLPHSHRLLWPCILEFLADARYIRALPEISRTIVGVAHNIGSNTHTQTHTHTHTHPHTHTHAHGMSVDYNTHPTILPPPALLATFLVPLCAVGSPTTGVQANAHVHIINALRAIVVRDSQKSARYSVYMYRVAKTYRMP